MPRMPGAEDALDTSIKVWLPLVGLIKLQVSFAECSLFHRAILQKRPNILSILLSKATPYPTGSVHSCEVHNSFLV